MGFGLFGFQKNRTFYKIVCLCIFQHRSLLKAGPRRPMRRALRGCCSKYWQYLLCFPFFCHFLSTYNHPLPQTVCTFLCVSTIELTISTVMLLLHLSIVKFYPVSEPVAWLCTQKNKQISEQPCNHQNAHDFAESSTWRLKTSVCLS